MSWRIGLVTLETEEDVVAARQRARQIAAALGFDAQDQTRIATAVSEIARNAVSYGKGGQAEFALDGTEKPQALQITIRDSGPGITDLQAVMSGVYRSATGMGKGIIGTRKLMDRFEITSDRHGTTAVLTKLRPRVVPSLVQKDIASLSTALSDDKTGAMQELRQQNRELLQSLADLAGRTDELHELTNELENTNRGVVALHAELEATAQELRKASELKTRFLSNMSHEFRTPLNSILALTRLLLDRTDGELSPEQEKQVRYISDAAAGLTELVNDLLDIAKVEAGKVDVHPSRFTVFEMFGALRGLLRPLRTNENVELIFEEPSGVPVLYTDEGKVTQILRNFISNALKYTDRGAVTVSAQFKLPDRILFAVQDTGIGIAREFHDRIFEEFEQVPGFHQTSVKGTGLGLPLSKRLAELLHGSVSVDSDPGKGSLFFLDVPARWTASGAGPVLSALDAKSEKPRILVADDEEAFRYVMRRMIDQNKYDIVEVSDGESALAAIQASAPDLVILDLNMPRCDGYAVLEDMSRHENTRNIPVIVSTSLVLTERDKERLVRSRTILSKATLSAELLSAVLSDALDQEADQ
ncbi:MAG TPA: ATP-binding protein [Rhizomicrobium sp.]|jgi:signal transduction histidine kinase|nr:ATP-binding protein [Rhizomicrobium sp.]